MYEVYWDDSGTDRDSPLAIAACYISTKRGWDAFVEAFDEIRWSEGCETFHMVEFAASHDKTKKPFCDWDRVKRKRVYERIAKAINEHKRHGRLDARPADPPATLAAHVQAPGGWQEGHRANFRSAQALRSEPSSVPELRQPVPHEQIPESPFQAYERCAVPARKRVARHAKGMGRPPLCR